MISSPTRYLIFRDGLAGRVVNVRPEHLAIQLQDGEEAREAPEDIGITTHTIILDAEGAIVAEPKRQEAPPPDLDALLQRLADTGEEDPALRPLLLDRLAARRYEMETSGVPFGEYTIPSDRDSQGLITPSWIKAKDDPSFTKRWKVAPGVWVDVDQAAMLAIGEAVFAHVAACFAREEEISAAITAATDAADLEASVAAIEPFWP